jgi:hypothetical protein
MNYLFLAYRDEKQWQTLPAGERDALEAACLANEQELRQSGHLLAVGALQDSGAALTVRLINGQVALGEDSLAGTARPLIRLFFIEARDLNEAIRVASQMPQARQGPIEVRPVSTEP